MFALRFTVVLLTVSLLSFLSARDGEAQTKPAASPNVPAPADATSDDFTRFGIYAKTAPRAKSTEAVETTLPLSLEKGDRIAYIGNTLLERSRHFGHFETLLHQAFPEHHLRVRNLAWPADTPDLQPRPDNFADTEQHLTHERADVIFAAFGFNESFAGFEGVEDFDKSLTTYLQKLKASAFNGEHGPRIVLLSPIANESISDDETGERIWVSNNNINLYLYTNRMRAIAERERVGFVDLFTPTAKAMEKTDLTFNGVHLTEEGYAQLADILFTAVFDSEPPPLDPVLRANVIDKNRQYMRRFRPLNTFYYTGGRNKTYGYLDFLPAMRNFDLMVANREQRIHALVMGQKVPPVVDDSNLPPLPVPLQQRGANKWLSAEDEKKAFKMDPRFEVNLFAGEEQFPDLAAPIQMRWDARGRLWVSCSTTYPHVYPGNEPNDKIIILEDTDGDGKADTSKVFADNLHIPLSFEFGNGGLFVSEQPHLTFLKDTDGDDVADERQMILTGFGTEDSHHSLHDFVWSPEGDLIFRESIFHHSQVETPYGPVRQANSGWFRFNPKTHRLTSFGSYPSTNPWGVTFDKWGQHVASHPVYAAAFHSPDPPYPQQHARPTGLQAYSGVCGHEFIDFDTFPEEMQGGFVKARYKPTNRIEFHRWKQGPFGFEEEYVGDILFSTNLSFIPVDLRFGPRGALYVCDWYNPVKGHMQYSLRDDRRDRHSGRIWRITAKGKTLKESPKIHGEHLHSLAMTLTERPEYRLRYLTKREIRRHVASRTDFDEILQSHLFALRETVELGEKPEFQLDPLIGPEQIPIATLEALWLVQESGIAGSPWTDHLLELFRSKDPMHRAAATRFLRHWRPEKEDRLPLLYPFDDGMELLRKMMNDPNGIVRMEAVIAASHIGTPEAFEVLQDVFTHPQGGHLSYAIECALNAHTMKKYWANDPNSPIPALLKKNRKPSRLREPKPNRAEREFDRQQNVKVVRIGCVPERMLFTVREFDVRPGQPVKIVFTNPDATDHNLVIVKPGKLSDVGIAANEMAKDPRNAKSDFIPRGQRESILTHTPMVGPNRSARVAVLRFVAPSEPGVYPFVCTFPGHWVIMNGSMVVANSAEEAKTLLAAETPQTVKQWSLDDFADLKLPTGDEAIARGMQAFVKARCNQCHQIAGHGVNLGPNLVESVKKYRGEKLLQQILEPSSEIHEKYRTQQFVLTDGRILSGVVMKETPKSYEIVTNFLTPNSTTTIPKDDIDAKIASRVSAMPKGLVDVLTKEEILDLLTFLETGYELPKHLMKHHHNHDR